MMMQRTIVHDSYCPRVSFGAAGFSEPFMIAPSFWLREGKTHKRIFKVLAPGTAQLAALPRSGKWEPDEFVYS